MLFTPTANPNETQRKSGYETEIPVTDMLPQVSNYLPHYASWTVAHIPIDSCDYYILSSVSLSTL